MDMTNEQDLVSLFEDKNQSEMQMLLADEKIKELRRNKMLKNAGDNQGLKDNLQKQFDHERHRAREIIKDKMIELDKIRQLSNIEVEPEYNHRNSRSRVQLKKNNTVTPDYSYTNNERKVGRNSSHKALPSPTKVEVMTGVERENLSQL